MRAETTPERLLLFMARLGRDVRTPGRVYLTGGATALLHGWRTATVDIDLVFEPESREIFEALPRLKDELDVNVEIAAPSHFIPEVPGWRERSLYIGAHGELTFYHYDPYSQALAKVERDHARDRTDVSEMVARGLVDPSRAVSLFHAIERELVRYPAVEPAAFAARVKDAFGG